MLNEIPFYGPSCEEHLAAQKLLRTKITTSPLIDTMDLVLWIVIFVLLLIISCVKIYSKCAEKRASKRFALGLRIEEG